MCNNCGETYKNNCVRQNQQLLSVYEQWVETWTSSVLQSMLVAHNADNLSDQLNAQVNQNPNVANDRNYVLAALNINNPEV